MSYEALDAPMWSPRPTRGYKTDWERSRNQDGTVPTKEAHYWVMRSCEAFANACTVHPACGRVELHFDDQRRLLHRPTDPLCDECAAWALQRLLAGHPLERGTLA